MQLLCVLFGNIPVIPIMGTGATDSRSFRRIGVPSYGVSGLFGVIASQSAQALARKREFGLLRHLGLSKRMLMKLLLLEAGLAGGAGALAGLGLGLGLSMVLVYVVNRQSFNWSMELHPPYLLLLALASTLVVLAIVTAVASGREAMGMGPVRAVREDW